jgi:ABC-type transport system substrate-binding protein
MVSERFDDYWEEGKPYLDGVRLLFIPDVNTKQQIMRSETAAAMSCEKGTKGAYDLLQIPGIKLELAENNVRSLIWDSKDPASPLYDVKVREALEYAINREDIAQTGYGMLDPVYSLIPSSNGAFDPDFTSRQYDPEMAKQLLTDAGYPNGFDLTIWCNNWGLNKASLAIMRDALSIVNVNVHYEYPDHGKLGALSQEGWDGALLTDSPMRANYNTTLRSVFLRTTSNVDAGWQGNEEIIAACEASFNTPEPDPEKIRYIVDDLVITKYAYLCPINGGGLSWGVHEIVMGDMFCVLGDASFLNPKEGWIASQ